MNLNDFFLYFDDFPQNFNCFPQTLMQFRNNSNNINSTEYFDNETFFHQLLRNPLNDFYFQESLRDVATINK
jgi:hypothetical protein